MRMEARGGGKGLNKRGREANESGNPSIVDGEINDRVQGGWGDVGAQKLNAETSSVLPASSSSSSTTKVQVLSAHMIPHDGGVSRIGVPPTTDDLFANQIMDIGENLDESDVDDGRKDFKGKDKGKGKEKEKERRLRKACKFCRGRKIACSGEPTGCRACLARGKRDCIYEETSVMGRPRKGPKPDETSNNENRTNPSKRTKTTGDNRRQAPTRVMGPSHQPRPPSPPSSATFSPDDLARGVSKLRLQETLEGTYERFQDERIGTLVRAQFFLVSPNAPPLNVPDPQTKNSTRFLYEVAMRQREPIVDIPSVTLSGGQEPRSRPRPASSSRLGGEGTTDANEPSTTNKFKPPPDIMPLEMSRNFWDNLQADVVSWFTWGCASMCDPHHKIGKYAMALMVDRCVPFTAADEQTAPDPPNSRGPRSTGEPTVPVSPETTISPSDPLRTLSMAEINKLISVWWMTSPSGFLINDAEITRTLDDGSYDPALVSILVGCVLDVLLMKKTSWDTNSTDGLSPSSSDSARPSSAHSSASSSTSTTPQTDPYRPPSMADKHAAFKAYYQAKFPEGASHWFFSHAERILFNRSAASGALDVTTIQALMIWSQRESILQQARRAWALNGTARALAREALKRSTARKSIGYEWSDHAEMEREIIINICWMNGIWGSWSFLSLGMPKATMLELVSGLPLPPSDYTQSASVKYRAKPGMRRLAMDDQHYKYRIKRYSERCRCISLIFTLWSRCSHPPPGENGSPPPDSATFHATIAQWLVEAASKLLPEANWDLTSEPAPVQQEPLDQSSFLCAVHSVFALHRLYPFDKPTQEPPPLSSQSFRIALEAIELILRSSVPLLKLWLERQESDHTTISDRNRLGSTIRISADALHPCVNLMKSLATSAISSNEIRYLSFQEEKRISRILADMEFCLGAGMDFEDPHLALPALGSIKESLFSLSQGGRATFPSLRHRQSTPSFPRVQDTHWGDELSPPSFPTSTKGHVAFPPSQTFDESRGPEFRRVRDRHNSQPTINRPRSTSLSQPSTSTTLAPAISVQVPQSGTAAPRRQPSSLYPSRSIQSLRYEEPLQGGRDSSSVVSPFSATSAYPSSESRPATSDSFAISYIPESQYLTAQYPLMPLGNTTMTPRENQYTQPSPSTLGYDVHQPQQLESNLPRTESNYTPYMSDQASLHPVPNNNPTFHAGGRLSHISHPLPSWQREDPGFTYFNPQPSISSRLRPLTIDQIDLSVNQPNAPQTGIVDGSRSFIWSDPTSMNDELALNPGWTYASPVTGEIPSFLGSAAMVELDGIMELCGPDISRQT